MTNFALKKYGIMETIRLQRRNIDLPVEAIDRLSSMAMAHGKTLKSYIEQLLISKAGLADNNPSPSGDEWYNDSENIAMVKEGMAQVEKGLATPCSDAEIKELLGL